MVINMKREKTKKCKELNKEMSDILNKYSKQYKFKKKSDFIWVSEKDFFFYIDFHLGITETDEALICSSRERCKPLWTDELLWEIMEMNENFSAPISLRGNGAFTFYGLPYNSTGIKIDNWTAEEIEEAIGGMIYNFDKYIKSFDSNYFYKNTDKIIYHNTLFELLYLIHLKDYEKAYLYANEMKDVYFINKDKKLSEYAMYYCRLKMNASTK